MRVLPERQVNSAYFTYLIVIQVSVWQHRRFHPSGSSVPSSASAGAAALPCSSAPTAPPQGPSLSPPFAVPPCRAPAPCPSMARSMLASSCAFLHRPLQRGQHPGVRGHREPGGSGSAFALQPPDRDRGAAALAGTGAR